MFNKKENKNEVIVLAPVNGTVKPLTKVKDEVFSQKMMGDGMAVTPTDDTVFTPIAGLVKVAFPTGHAYGIIAKQGPEILVHIGVDTVGLNGKGFSPKVTQGKKIKDGAVLAVVDFKSIAKNVPSTDVIVIVTELAGFKIVERAKGKILAGDQLFKLVKA
jgi:glucose-specific phosphotransferase system IIA component